MAYTYRVTLDAIYVNMLWHLTGSAAGPRRVIHAFVIETELHLAGTVGEEQDGMAVYVAQEECHSAVWRHLLHWSACGGAGGQSLHPHTL